MHTLDMQIIREGMVRFYASKDKEGKISKELDIFYNPVMKFNRDISVMLLNSLDIKGLQIADIMAGSGVRSLRFLKELNKGKISNITVNDYDKGFDKLFLKNLRLNVIKYDKKKIFIESKDANVMLLDSSGFDYIDIDPFGSPNDFLEAAIVRLSRRGILAVTATDTASLSGTFPDACLRKYWAKPLLNYMMHETGLRILIRRIQLIGAAHEKALTPIYSYFKDHYFRVYFRCRKGKSFADDILKQHQYLSYCNKCMHFRLTYSNDQSGEALCKNCGFDGEFDRKMNNSTVIAGPLWSGDLFEEKLAQKMLVANKEDVNNDFLGMVLQESRIKTFGFYDIHQIARKYKLIIPNFSFLMKRIIEKKYLAARTHFSMLGIKSDIPLDDLVKIMKS
jgi:tRNA (guanine26-N2/guanine27-N2)-dimethyltransferase